MVTYAEEWQYEKNISGNISNMHRIYMRITFRLFLIGDYQTLFGRDSFASPRLFCGAHSINRNDNSFAFITTAKNDTI